MDFADAESKLAGALRFTARRAADSGAVGDINFIACRLT